MALSEVKRQASVDWKNISVRYQEKFCKAVREFASPIADDMRKIIENALASDMPAEQPLSLPQGPKV